MFEFQRKAHPPGSLATGVAWFTTRFAGATPLSQGPFYAYLSPRRNTPDLGADDVHLGRLRISRIAGSGFRAMVTFRVPRWRPGLYYIRVCDRPCIHGQVGDLVGGPIFIGTPLDLARYEVGRSGPQPSHQVRRATARRSTGHAESSNSTGGGALGWAAAGVAALLAAMVVFGMRSRRRTKRGEQPVESASAVDRL